MPDNKKKKYNIEIIFYSLAIFLSLLIGFIYFFPTESKKIFPYHLLLVLSDSMEPIIHKNDAVVIKKQEHYQVGDIISFKYELFDDGQEYLITHFLAEDQGETIKTQSNKSSSFDDWEIEKDAIYGKVLLVLPKLGYLLLPLFKYARPILVFILMLTLLAIWKLILELKEIP